MPTLREVAREHAEVGQKLTEHIKIEKDKRPAGWPEEFAALNQRYDELGQLGEELKTADKVKEGSPWIDGTDDDVLRKERRFNPDKEDLKGPELAIMEAYAFRFWLTEQSGKADRGTYRTPEKRYRDAAEYLGVSPEDRSFEFGRIENWKEPEVAEIEMRQALTETRAGELGKVANLGLELVPEGFLRRLYDQQKAWSPIRNFATVIRTPTGNDMMVPMADDIGDGSSDAVVAAEGSIGSEVSPATAERTLKAWKFTSNPVKMSAEIAQDAFFDMQSWIISLAAGRHGRGQNLQFYGGDGTTEPEGYITRIAAIIAATAGSDVSVGAATGPFDLSDIATAAGAGSTSLYFRVSDFTDLEYSVDPAYIALPGQVAWSMHHKMIGEARKLTDNNNLPIWTAGNFQTGQPQMISGWPVITNQNELAADAAAPSATELPMHFGNWSYFLIRDSGGIRVSVSDQRYWDEDRIGIVVLQRTDSRMMVGTDWLTTPIHRAIYVA